MGVVGGCFMAIWLVVPALFAAGGVLFTAINRSVFYIPRGMGGGGGRYMTI